MQTADVGGECATNWSVIITKIAAHVNGESGAAIEKGKTKRNAEQKMDVFFRIVVKTFTSFTELQFS